MQPLSDFDLFLNFAVAIGMPLLILANLMNWGANISLQHLPLA